MRFSAVIFDHDGTLVDSLAVVVAATSAVLRRVGGPIPEPASIIQAMVLPTAPRMGFHLGIADPGQQSQLADAYYAEALLQVTAARVYPGVPELCAAVAALGLPQAVVSNNEGVFVRRCMAHVGLMAWFRPSAVLGEEDMAAPKPHHAGPGAAARRLGVDGNGCAFVGDSPVDLGAARAAGMAAIGVTWGTHTRQELETYGFDALVDHPRELLTLLR
jgi:phosphoglycolate phosphatase-like HAD superfamily hydrolase